MTATLAERFHAARRDPELCVLEGFHALKHALRFDAGIIDAVARDDVDVAALTHRLAPDLDERLSSLVDTVAAEEYEGLAPLPHPTGVMAIARRRPWDLAGIERGAGPAVLLENPVHLGNLGAAIRVAAAASAAGVICCGRHDPWSPESVRAAAGLHFAVPVVADELPLRSSRPLVAVTADAPSLLEAGVPDNALLAFGSEREGLSAALLDAADRRVSLPMREEVSSLNLATAVAATLYALRALDAR